MSNKAKEVRFVPFMVTDGLWCVWDEELNMPIEVGHAGSYITEHMALAMQWAFDKSTKYIGTDWRKVTLDPVKLSDIRTLDLVMHMALVNDHRLGFMPVILKGVKERVDLIHTIASNYRSISLVRGSIPDSLLTKLEIIANAFYNVRKDAGL